MRTRRQAAQDPPEDSASIQQSGRAVVAQESEAAVPKKRLNKRLAEVVEPHAPAVTATKTPKKAKTKAKRSDKSPVTIASVKANRKGSEGAQTDVQPPANAKPRKKTLQPDKPSTEQPKKRIKARGGAKEAQIEQQTASQAAQAAPVRGAEPELQQDSADEGDELQHETTHTEALRVDQNPEAGAAEPMDGHDDNDDGPEEVSMATGRALAAAQRAVERQMKAERSRAAKERGQKRAALAEAERDAKLAAAAERDISQAGAADGSGGVPNLAREALPDQATDDQDDLLPPEIVAALAQRSREAFAAEASSSQHGSEGAGQPGTVSTGKVKPKTGRRRDLSQPKKVGPVYVQLVSKVGRPKASESAAQFLRERLHGGEVKRSADMLLPPAARRLGPSMNFVPSRK